jgi:BirA family transcriptional regulator, biotin operon repressor / biotin---[acetyl-CoA-carboxylase] ligase
MTTMQAPWGAAADPARRIGRAIEFHESIGSTNDRARALLAEPGGEGVAVVADLQTDGRGRHGRRWSSPAGVNLMVSVGLHPAIAAVDAWMLGATVALALREACEVTLGGGSSGTALKWPNDVVDAAGRKIAGILVETAVVDDRLGSAVVGTGVNVNWSRNTMPAEIADRAVALCDLAGSRVDRVALLGAYLAALDRRLTALEAGASPLDEYRAASWLDGRPVQVALGAGMLEGRVAGIGAGGTLLLETPAGTMALEHGEVLRVGTGAQVP